MSPICGIDENHWFAARLSSGGAIVNRRLEADGIRFYRTKFAPGIVFLRCDIRYTSEMISVFWGKIYFYLDVQRRQPAVISDKEMDNFILVTSLSDELISLGKVSPEFLLGERVRVKEGVFKGAEGVVKRIKGDRRLIVSIDGVTAVATCFIAPQFLEKIPCPPSRTSSTTAVPDKSATPGNTPVPRPLQAQTITKQNTI